MGRVKISVDGSVRGPVACVRGLAFPRLGVWAFGGVYVESDCSDALDIISSSAGSSGTRSSILTTIHQIMNKEWQIH
ncbi:conserved hypothetical protein [Ricinus communis]|uniref:Uncharacterized protein n=1 Tax=Ricinus communis TaxID=3988 RepID=B9SM18_RICCO|nr:conserved hypothetical protein [Ricinus communis]